MYERTDNWRGIDARVIAVVSCGGGGGPAESLLPCAPAPWSHDNDVGESCARAFRTV